MTPQDARTIVVGRYAVGELLGRGGMGEVFDATDLRLDRPVALKRLRADLAHDATMRRRVETEARLAARLVHPNVVTVFDSGIADGHPFIVMERLEGRTLRDELEGGPISADRARALALQVLGALAHAHEIGLIHRDVKPGNVLAATAGTWKVADFGIATSSGTEHTLTRTGELLGSPSYLAPERLEGQPATPASDLYGLGVLLYEAVTGTRPFGQGNAFALAIRIREGRFRPVREVRPDVDVGIADAIERAMSTHPASRFASAEEMAAALRWERSADAAETIVLGSPSDATDVLLTVADRPRRIGTPDRRTRAAGPAARSRRRLLTMLVGAAVTTMLAAAGLAGLVGGGEAPSGGAGASSRTTAPSPNVPGPLQDALERLQETISP